VKLSTDTLSILVVVALGFDVLLLALVIMTAVRGAGGRRGSGPIAMDDALRGVLEGHARTLQQLNSAVRQLSGEDSRLRDRLMGAVQRVGLVRYDAFEDMGGRLSFSCALLDEHGSGVVVTSINGRQDTRVYAKPVAAGSSDHNLSEEEEQAIREAVSTQREAVQAG
jgi:hypothetical protein